MALMTFQECERLLKSARGNTKPLGGRMRLEYIGARYDSDDGYMQLSFEPGKGYAPSAIVRIYRDNSYAISNAGWVSPTTVKKLQDWSPLAASTVYSSDGRIYFGFPVGRYSLPDDKWVFLRRNGIYFDVIGAGPPDTRQAKEWVLTISETYAEMLSEWVANSDTLPPVPKDIDLSPAEIAEIMLSGEMSAEILWGSLLYKRSKEGTRNRVPRNIELARLSALAWLPEFLALGDLKSTSAIREALEETIARALFTVREGMRETVQDYVAKNGYPEWMK